jgi:hypothetical protein
LLLESTLDDAKRAHKPPPDVVSTQNMSRLRRPTGPRRAAMHKVSHKVLQCHLPDVKMAQVMRTFAICLWKFHFYGYEKRDGHDDYREDLRNSIKYLEDLQTLPDEHRPAHVDADLSLARSVQLDWCIHDLTPATFEAYRDS